MGFATRFGEGFCKGLDEGFCGDCAKFEGLFGSVFDSSCGVACGGACRESLEWDFGVDFRGLELIIKQLCCHRKRHDDNKGFDDFDSIPNGCPRAEICPDKLPQSHNKPDSKKHIAT